MADAPTSASVDLQDPLPESNWWFRRIALLGTLATMLFHRTWLVMHGQPVDHWTDYQVLAVLVLYTVAPSAEQVAKMMATVSLLKPGNLALKRTSSTMTTEAGVSTGTSTSTITPTTPVPAAATAPVAPEEDDGTLPPDQQVKRPLVSPLVLTE